jgi:hypothetical protein
MRKVKRSQKKVSIAPLRDWSGLKSCLNALA